ncbi:hypothetical protein PR202_gb24254 [Eleusine coracana subsp. coracana]|uniref:F-box domain-containing protein n=1 Tax=Eleusine coracana subsp. coracana TaxID=191504 RepID=A0AAV5FI96_ELECO|nr:hypothetical protein PR202_gb24254 [Eleusine coracana subsp. coracana]
MPSATALPVGAAAPRRTRVQRELPDELLEDILLRLDDAADLARASATYTSIRRLITTPRFLRRFRSLHAPPILGFLDYTTSRSADFTFPFLANKDTKRWRVSDVRDGCILLARQTVMSPNVFNTFTVYDPLHRRHIQIPAIPTDLVGSSTGKCVGRQHRHQMRCLSTNYFEAFLAPSRDDDDEEPLTTPLQQLMCNVHTKHKVVNFRYSLATRTWRRATSFEIETFTWMQTSTMMSRHYAHNCFFWTGIISETARVLDTCEMKFFVVDLPPESKARPKAIVEADGVNKLGLLVIDGCASRVCLVEL